jgi:hypothetical protein
VVTILLACLIVAICFAIGWFHTRGVTPVIAAALWLAYPPYEYWYQSRCTGECNIRVDLVLIAPVLLVVSILAGISLVHRRKKTGA